MRECDIVVGTLLFFLAKNHLAINGQKSSKNIFEKERKKETGKN